MKDAFRVAHFDLKTKRPAPLTSAEERRINETVALIPPSWRTIVDVGCGDGRISRELVKRGLDVVGIDWSANSVAHFPGATRVCDIREPWPFEAPFDGAVCCEVLEHLAPTEARKVISNLKSFTRLGFLITVPAREELSGNTVTCQACHTDYHIWGHCQRFNTFGDVDSMIELRSIDRKLIESGILRTSDRLSKWQKYFGFSPWSPSYLCPHCGEKLRRPPTPAVWKRIANRAIALFQRLGSPFQQPRGWYACLYAGSSASSEQSGQQAQTDNT